MANKFKIVIGCDDAGFQYKEILKSDLQKDSRVESVTQYFEEPAWAGVWLGSTDRHHRAGKVRGRSCCCRRHGTCPSSDGSREGPGHDLAATRCQRLGYPVGQQGRG